MLCGTWSSTTTVGALVLVLWKFSVGVKMFLNVLDNFFVRFGKVRIYSHKEYLPLHALQTKESCSANK